MANISVNVLNLEFARDLAIALAEIRNDPPKHARCIDAGSAFDIRCATCRRADEIIGRLAQGLAS